MVKEGQCGKVSFDIQYWYTQQGDEEYTEKHTAIQ